MHPYKNYRNLVIAVVILSAFLIVGSVNLLGEGLLFSKVNANPSYPMKQSQDTTPTPVPTVEVKIDHTKFPILQQKFATGPDVTKVCLSCHQDAASQIMQTSHWTLEVIDPNTGDSLGKRHLINNTTLGLGSNEPRCNSCHIGYDYKDKTFDFKVQENVDCLACHDTTGTYKKFPAGAGNPAYEPKEFDGKIWEALDLSAIALNVGKTSRQTCGNCHFSGGSKDVVKHADLDPSLLNTTKKVDAHMGVDGLNYQCTECHKTTNHKISGTLYSGDAGERVTCDQCHDGKPHPKEIINNHLGRLACETCHVPQFSKNGSASLVSWDWSKAGTMGEDGKPVIKKDNNGNPIYDTQKGELTWQENIVPSYRWFNGKVQYVNLTTKIDPSKPVVINQFQGEFGDKDSKIYPVKILKGKIPFDSGNNTLVIPHLYPTTPEDQDAYWASYDWNKAIASGMTYNDAQFSGQFGFIEAEYNRVENHMIAPSTGTLTCKDCHTATGGRLDFVSLGYSTEDAKRLTQFPPYGLKMASLESNAPACISCHKDITEAWQQSKHSGKSVGCAACHTLESGKQHPGSPMAVDRSENVCGVCHLDHLNDWKASKHAEAGITCIACHEAHTQSQKLVGGNKATCESCHHKAAADVPHSTHFKAGLKCTDCHDYTNLSTGHNFAIGADTCLRCHGENLHASNLIASFSSPTPSGSTTAVAGADKGVTPTPAVALSTVEQPVAKEGGVLGFPIWLGVLLGILIGGAVVWLLIGIDPGKESDDKESNE